jgi:hypothetical protein
MKLLFTNHLRVAMLALGLGAAAVAAAGCATDAIDQDEPGWNEPGDDTGDDGSLDDESADAVLEASPDGLPDPTFICDPQEIRGEVVRLSLDANGNMRARGAVWSNVAPCPVSVHVELRRNGNLIDSQQKSCGDESCSSRLLSAGNPAGVQTFCATVRQTSTGALLDKECKDR